MRQNISPGEFQDFITELEDTFGRKYPPRQIQKFFLRANRFAKKVWEKSIDELSTYSKFMPSVVEIQESLWKSAKELDLYPESHIDPMKHIKCKRCHDSGIVLRKLRRDLVKDFYCNDCMKYKIHDRYTEHQLRCYIDGKPIPKDRLEDIRNRAYYLMRGNPNLDMQTALINAIVAIIDIRNITLNQLVSLSQDGALFQKRLLEHCHGKDYDSSLENQTLKETFMNFAVKESLTFGKEDTHAEH